ncbi:MAG: aldo/keto reductase [Chitinivibrionales bacterium]|nr:aldo/keto reductase [Chitinivibrionales bacterium]
MKYIYLGKTGLIVSRICLGTMTFGQKDWGCNKKTAFEIIDTFLDGGGNFIDTADLYAGGVSEEIVGEALKDKKRDDIVLATKGFFRTADTPNAKGLSRKHLIEACEASLRRLNTDFIDLYQIHGPDPFTPLEETMLALEHLVASGKVRYIGCSNLYAWQIVKATGIARSRGYEQFRCAQHLYNLIIRDVEREILPASHDQGMGFICWSPLASGMLTGKYKKESRPKKGTRVWRRAAADMPRYWHDRGFHIIDETIEVAKKTGKTPAQIALAWLLHDTRVSSVIVGGRKPGQIKENCRAGTWDMPRKYHTRLSEATQFDLGYPHSWISQFGSKDFQDPNIIVP